MDALWGRGWVGGNSQRQTTTTKMVDAGHPLTVAGTASLFESVIAHVCVCVG
jgi:hypothetical protein